MPPIFCPTFDRLLPPPQIVTSSTFTFADTAELVEYQEKRQHSWEYGRWGQEPLREVSVGNRVQWDHADRGLTRRSKP